MADNEEWGDYEASEYLDPETPLPGSIREDLDTPDYKDDQDNTHKPTRTPPPKRGARDLATDHVAQPHYYDDDDVPPQHVDPMPEPHGQPTKPRSKRYAPKPDPQSPGAQYSPHDPDYLYEEFSPRRQQPRDGPRQRAPLTPSTKFLPTVTTRDEYRPAQSSPSYHDRNSPPAPYYPDDPPDRRNYTPTQHEREHDPDYDYWDDPPTRSPRRAVSAPNPHMPHSPHAPHNPHNPAHPRSPHTVPYAQRGYADAYDYPSPSAKYQQHQPVHSHHRRDTRPVAYTEGRRRGPPSRVGRSRIAPGEMRSRIIEVEVSMLRDHAHSGDKKAHDHYLDNKIKRKIQDMFYLLDPHANIDAVLNSPELEALRMMHAGLSPQIIQRIIDKQFGNGSEIWSGVECVLQEENPRDYSEYLGRYLYKRHWERKHGGPIDSPARRAPRGTPRGTPRGKGSPRGTPRGTPKSTKKSGINPYKSPDGTIDFSLSATGGSGRDLRIPAIDVSRGQNYIMQKEVAFKKTRVTSPEGGGMGGMTFWQLHSTTHNAPYYLHDACLKYLKSRNLVGKRMWIHGEVKRVDTMTVKIGNRYDQPPNSKVFIVSINFPTRPSLVKQQPLADDLL